MQPGQGAGAAGMVRDDGFWVGDENQRENKSERLRGGYVWVLYIRHPVQFAIDVL